MLGLRFTFNSPVEYPGIRFKHVSRLVNGLLVAAFMLLLGQAVGIGFDRWLDAVGY